MRTAATLLWTIVALGALAALSALSDGALADTQDLELALDGEARRPLQNGTAPFGFSISVSGDGYFTYVLLELMDEPSGWAHSITANTSLGVFSSPTDLTLKVGVGELVRCTLTVVVEQAPLMGDYDMVIRTIINEVPYNQRDLAISVSVARWTDLAVVHVDPPEGELYTCLPASIVTVRIAVFNRGNGPDPIHLELECTMADSGWRAWCDDSVDEDLWTPELPADPEGRRPYIVSVMTLIPEGERAGTLGQLFINATARSNASVQARPVYARFLCAQFFQFTAYVAGTTDLRLGPDEVVEARMHVQNTGNGPDTLEMALAWNGDVREALFAAPNPRSITLGPGEEGDLACVVRAAADATVGTFFLNASVRSSAPDGLPIVRTLIITLVQRFRVGLEFDPVAVWAAPGGVAEFLGRVSNDGNGVDRVAVSFDGMAAGWSVDVHPEVATLEPHTWAAVLVRVHLPGDLEGAAITEQALDVSASSLVGGGGAVAYLVVHVGEFFRVEWTQGGRRLTSPTTTSVSLTGRHINPYSKALEWESTGLVLLSVGNAGTRATLDAWCSHPDVDVALYPTTAELGPLEERAVSFIVRVRTGAATGDHVVRVRASIAGSPELQRTLLVPLVIETVDLALDANMTATGLPVEDLGYGFARVGDGGTITLHMTVHNRGTANVTGAVLHISRTGPDGSSVPLDSYQLRLGAGANQTLTFTWLAEERGSHTFDAYIELADQSRIDNDRASLLVTVKGDDGPAGPDIPWADVGTAMLALLVLGVLVASMVSTVSKARQAQRDQRAQGRRPR